jgi:hypothetical protein
MTYGYWFVGTLVLSGCIVFVVIEDKSNITKKTNYILLLVFIILPGGVFLFLAFLNPAYFCYGYSTKKFRVIVQQEAVLWTEDEYGFSLGSLASVTKFRIQGIELDKGTIVFKTMIPEEFEPLGHNTELVWGSAEKKITVMDLQSGKTERVMTDELLVTTFPELHEGIYQCNYNTKTGMADVLSNDGVKLSIDPPSFHKTEHPQESIRNQSENSPATTLYFKEKNGQQSLTDKNGNQLNPKLIFYSARIIATDSLNSSVCILSYTDTTKTAYLLSSVSNDGKLLWESTQAAMKAGDFFNTLPEFRKAFPYKNNLILCFDGFIVSLSIPDGGLNWMRRM